MTNQPKFYVANLLSASRTQIGYQVLSASKSGGVRTHFQLRGTEKAKTWCDMYAAALNDEYEAGVLRAAGKTDEAKALRDKATATMADIKRQHAEHAAQADARRLAKIVANPFASNLRRARDRAVVR